jgi:predicted nucleic acid-binding protein
LVVADTSIWIAYLRAGAQDITREFDAALQDRQILASGPVVAELVAGTRPHDRSKLITSLAGLPWADLDRNAWLSIGLLAAELRDRGQALPLTDLQIAVAAHAHSATLWTADQHFERLAPLLDGLKLQLVP